MSSIARTDFSNFILKPRTIHIGADIEGLDLSSALSNETTVELQEALASWKVLFFTEQHLDHAAHVAFARQLGQPTIGHAVFGHDSEFPEIYSVAKHRTANTVWDQKSLRPWTNWHADITAAVNPPFASILRGVTIPPFGGDTFWTNLAQAYLGLSESLRQFLEKLDGHHRFELPSKVVGAGGYHKDVEDRYMESVHPLITVHPQSGEKVLYVSPDFLYRIDELKRRESDALLELLWEQAVRTEFTVRHRWTAGDIVIWDNRSTAHLAPSDIFDTDFDRQLYRVTLVGEKLVGSDGRTSRSISGDPVLSVEEELAQRESRNRN
jgi:alpha-ketoglutarate-dependent sulfate ester dioxygenase